MIKDINFVKRISRNAIGLISPKLLASIDSYRNNGRWINWKNPQDLNEKIMWLSICSDTSKWTPLADKFEVRKYIKENGYENLLVKLYGVWDNANDIDYSSLPNSFILKTTHGSGTNILVKDKSQLDIKKINKQLNKWIKIKFGWPMEPHYLRIKPRIIAEELLDATKQPIESCSLIDYKIFCFDGIPDHILVCDNRNGKYFRNSLYFPDWTIHNDKMIFSDSVTKTKEILPPPINLELMLEASRKLSSNFPEVRVDWYEVNGHLYFGEMTFTSNAGIETCFTYDYLLEMGRKITLPKK